MFGVRRIFFGGRGRKSRCHRENVNVSLGRGFKALADLRGLQSKMIFLGRVRRVWGGGSKVGFM